MTKWNNLFRSLIHKHEIGYTLNVNLITDHRKAAPENLLKYTERFLQEDYIRKVDPIYGMGRAAGKAGLAMAEFGKVFGKLREEASRKLVEEVPHV